MINERGSIWWDLSGKGESWVGCEKENVSSGKLKSYKQKGRERERGGRGIDGVVTRWLNRDPTQLSPSSLRLTFSFLGVVYNSGGSSTIVSCVG